MARSKARVQYIKNLQNKGGGIQRSEFKFWHLNFFLHFMTKKYEKITMLFIYVTVSNFENGRKATTTLIVGFSPREWWLQRRRKRPNCSRCRSLLPKSNLDNFFLKESFSNFVPYPSKVRRGGGGGGVFGQLFF